MALTPEDVINKRFQPTKFREGYDQDEVDDFLDEIVTELRRLNQENDELRQKLSASEAKVSELSRGTKGAVDTSSAKEEPATSPAGTKPVGSAADTQKDQNGADAAKSPAAQTPSTSSSVEAPAVAGSAVAGAAVGGAAAGAGVEHQAAGVLSMAQKLHDEYVRSGLEQREKIVSDARFEANRTLSEADEKHTKQIQTFEAKKADLEKKIEELRIFERDYRNNLTSYLEGQLREINTRGSVVPGSSAAGLRSESTSASTGGNASAGSGSSSGSSALRNSAASSSDSHR